MEGAREVRVDEERFASAARRCHVSMPEHVLTLMHSWHTVQLHTTCRVATCNAELKLRRTRSILARQADAVAAQRR